MSYNNTYYVMKKSVQIHSYHFSRQLLFDDDIPFSHNVHTVHFFPSGGERGQEDKLKVLTTKLTLCTKMCICRLPMKNY